MSDTAPFALHSRAYVCGDGPELLVYQAGNGEPMWKAFAEGILVGVGLTDDLVIALDSDGRVLSWKLATGAKQDELDLGLRAHALAVDSKTGVFAVLAAHEVVVGGAWGQNRVPLDHGTAVALGPDGGSLGLGTSHGAFYAVEPTSGAAWGTIQVGAPIDGVAWSALGYWVVAAGQGLYKIAADASAILGTIDVGHRCTHLAVSADGLLAALCGGPRDVKVYELHGDGRIAVISYASRSVGSMSFASGGVLGIGLDDGDANRIALLTGEISRTGQHRGRAFSQWRTEVQVDPGGVRAAMARVTLGGNGPIAKQVFRDKKGKAVEEREPPNRVRSCAVSCLVTIVSIIVCSGCSGLGYVAWIKIYYG